VSLTLLDWRRRVHELYAAVRVDPVGGLEPFRTAKDDLFRTHPDTPVPTDRRPTFSGLRYHRYDAGLRFDVEVEPVEPALVEIEGSAGSLTPFRRFGRVRLDGLGSLDVFWLETYGGGVFLPFADPVHGPRYVLDTVKGADLGGGDGRLVVDFNYAYFPSCTYDGRWACPLAPPGNRLEVEVPAGETQASA
jgi:uncharacterized protein